MENALLGNAYTRVVFRVGDEDARRLADGFSFFEGKDLQGLERGQAIARLGSARADCNLATIVLPHLDVHSGEKRRFAIVERSRRSFAVPLSELRRAPIESPRPTVTSAASETVRPETEIPREGPSSPGIAVEPLQVATKGPPAACPKIPAESMTLGRGGAEHKYLQHLIKRLGEEREFRAIIEEQIGEGKSVDVVLRRDSVALAFEISVTTETEHELGNLKKCAGLGYAQLFFVSTSKRKRDQIARRLKADGGTTTVTVLSPEDIVPALDALEIPGGTESTVRGYKVKINRQSLSYEDVVSRRSAVAKIVAQSIAGQISK